MSDQPGRRRGRPRKWANEAERSRAYRERKAAELAEPVRLRAAANAAQAAAAQLVASPRPGRGRPSAGNGERKPHSGTWPRRVTKPGGPVRAQRSTAERDDARRLLRRKLQWAKRFSALPGVRDDPQALLAIVAELEAELARLRRERDSLHKLLRLPPEELAARQRAWQPSSRRS